MPLHNAASGSSKNVAIFRLLLAQPKVEFNKPGNYGQTALHFGAEWGNVEIVELLLACPGIEVELDDDGHTHRFT